MTVDRQNVVATPGASRRPVLWSLGWAVLTSALVAKCFYWWGNAPVLSKWTMREWEGYGVAMAVFVGALCRRWFSLRLLVPSAVVGVVVGICWDSWTRRRARS